MSKPARKPRAKKKGSKGLLARQRLFVEYYLECWNATEAARRAGYSKKFLHTNANKLLQNTTISALVEQRIKEKAMDADEVLARLAAHARGSLASFLTPGGFIDLTTDEARQDLYLLKKAKVRKRTGERDDEPWEEVETEIELHDPQAALVQLGRYHKLFVDKTEESGMVRHIFEVKYDDSDSGAGKDSPGASAPPASAAA